MEINLKRIGILVWCWINRNDCWVVISMGKILECGIKELNLWIFGMKNCNWILLSIIWCCFWFCWFCCFFFSFVYFMCCYCYRIIMIFFNRIRYIFCISIWFYILNICIYIYIFNKIYFVYYWVEVIYFLKWEKYIMIDVCELNLKFFGVIRVIEFYFMNFIELYW